MCVAHKCLVPNLGSNRPRKEAGRFHSFTSFHSTTMPDDNMPLIYRHCLYHIDSIDPLNLSNMLFDHDGGRQWICSRSLPKPLTIETIDTPVIDAPIIFQVIGQISRRKNLVRIRNPAGDMVKAVIWVECRDDRASRALWARIPRSLTLVSVAAESYLSHSKAFEIDPDSGIMRMRIVWSPNEGVDNKVPLSIFRFNSFYSLGATRRSLLLLVVIGWRLELSSMDRLSLFSLT